MFAQVICRRSNGDSSIHAREVILLLAANRFHLFDLSDGTAINDATERHHERRILAAALSPCTHYVASSCEAKQLKLFTDLPDGQWHLHKHWDLPKRVYTLHFTQGSQKIVVADRSGDVYRCSLGVDDDDKELLLGHVSMITDLLMTPDERYIITADQDEKIRVTNYPHTFDIHNFCLGHECYVSAIVCPRFASDRLISGGGDERLLVWDYLSGKILQAVDLKAAILGAGSDNPLDMRRIKSSSINDVAVIFDNLDKVLMFKFSENSELKFDKLLELNGKLPIDIEFDSQDRLWVTMDVTDEDDSPLLVFDYQTAVILPIIGDLNVVNQERQRFECQDIVPSTEGQFTGYFTNSELRKLTIEEYESRREAKKAKLNATTEDN